MHTYLQQECESCKNHGCNTKHPGLAILKMKNTLAEIHSGQDEQGGDFGRFSGIPGNRQRHPLLALLNISDSSIAMPQIYHLAFSSP